MLWRVHLTRLAAFVAICVGLAGCGGTDPHKASSGAAADPPAAAWLHVATNAKPYPGGAPHSSDESDKPVARVGNVSITKAALDRRIAMEVQAELPSERILPIPPAFTKCIEQLEALAKTKRSPRSAQGALKSRCRQLRDKFVTKELDTLIGNEWVIEEAREEGLKLTDQEVRERLEHLKATEFGSEAKFNSFLAQTGENVPDVLFNLEKQMAVALIFGKIKQSVGPVTPTSVALYYNENKSKYAKAEQRDLGLIRTKTAAAALRAKKELEAGRSFASVAKSLPNEQPLYTSKGLLIGLEPHVYSEKAINDAIFSAQPNVVSGPVQLDLAHHAKFRNAADIQNIDGFYVFKVFKIRASYQNPLSKVKAEITRTLPRFREKDADAAFIAQWRTKWRARTDCSPGYVVRKCHQFRPTPGEAPEDAYTLG